MTRRVKYFCLVVVAQAGCLGVGVWMHSHFMASSTMRAAREQAWSDIETHTRALQSALEGFDPADASIPETVSDLLKPTCCSVSTGVMVVDPAWGIVLPARHGGGADEPARPPESAVEWVPEKDAPAGGLDPARGRITLLGVPHFAVAAALANGSGYAVSYRPIAEFERRVGAIVQSSPMIGAMTFVWTSTLLIIAVYLVLTRLHDEIDRERHRSATGALMQTQNLVRTRDAIIFGLAKLAESRDPDTGDHLERISVYSTMIASSLRRHPEYRDEVTPAFVRLIGISSALHDIGKVGVEDRILLKPSLLTPDERVEMQIHTIIGGECLRDIERRLGGSNFLQMAREIAYSHHEDWSGSGYPLGLQGAETPLAARIVAIADIYDALSSKRVYKEPLSHEECVAIIRNESGKKLDPNLVQVWLSLESRFRAVAMKYADSSTVVEEVQPADPDTADSAVPDVADLCAVSCGESGGYD